MLDARPRLRLGLALPLTALACDGGSTTPESNSSPAEAKTSAASSPGATSPNPVAELPALSAPRGVPASAKAVAVIRLPETLTQTMIRYDLLGGRGANEDMKALVADIDAFLIERLGVAPSGLTSATVYWQGENHVGAILDGVTGKLVGEPHGEHEGVAIVRLDGVLAAHHDGRVFIGSEEAIKAGLSVATNQAEALTGPLAELLTADSVGASFVAAVDVASLPSDAGIPAKYELKHALARLSTGEMTLTVVGGESGLKSALSDLEAGLDVVVSMAEQQKNRASGDDLAEGLAAISAYHWAKRLDKVLVRKHEGDRLTVSLPLGDTANPMLLTSAAGIGAAIAIPAFVKYTRRAKTAEAKVNLAKMFDATSAYFNEEHVERGATNFVNPGEGAANVAAHACPNDGSASGETPITPPLSVKCAEGPGGRCVPASQGGTDGYYPMSLWTDNDVWNGLNFQMEQGHYFHYQFKWSNETTGYGACQFTALAFGDLDNDGIYSTFERSGAADISGVNAAAGLFIDRESE